MSDGTKSELGSVANALGDGRERLRRLETIFVDAQACDLRLKSLSRNS
jgi:hypothetical protein